MKVTEAKKRGFDLSEKVPDEQDVVTIACSQCAAVVINGVPCHETGCPNRNHHKS